MTRTQETPTCPTCGTETVQTITDGPTSSSVADGTQRCVTCWPGNGAGDTTQAKGQQR